MAQPWSQWPFTDNTLSSDMWPQPHHFPVFPLRPATPLRALAPSCLQSWLSHSLPPIHQVCGCWAGQQQNEGRAGGWCLAIRHGDHRRSTQVHHQDERLRITGMLRVGLWAWRWGSERFRLGPCLPGEGGLGSRGDFSPSGGRAPSTELYKPRPAAPAVDRQGPLPDGNSGTRALRRGTYKSVRVKEQSWARLTQAYAGLGQPSRRGWAAGARPADGELAAGTQ